MNTLRLVKKPLNDPNNKPDPDTGFFDTGFSIETTSTDEIQLTLTIIEPENQIDPNRRFIEKKLDGAVSSFTADKKKLTLRGGKTEINQALSQILLYKNNTVGSLKIDDKLNPKRTWGGPNDTDTLTNGAPLLMVQLSDYLKIKTPIIDNKLIKDQKVSLGNRFTYKIPDCKYFAFFPS